MKPKQKNARPKSEAQGSGASRGAALPGNGDPMRAALELVLAEMLASWPESTLTPADVVNAVERQSQFEARMSRLLSLTVKK